MDNNLGPDVRLAISAIAAELGVQPDDLPKGVGSILRAYGAARYGEGARDFLLSVKASAKIIPQVGDGADDTTPVIGKHGRRRREQNPKG